MPPLPEALILVWAPLAPRVSDRVWGQAQVVLRGALRAPGARTVTTAVRVMGRSAERHFTHAHRVLNRAVWSACQGRRLLWGLLLTRVVPPGATRVLGADDTVERRSGRQLKANGGDRAAVRSTHTHVRRWCGRTWVAMLRLVPVPWSRRVWALPLLTAWCWPAATSTRRRPTTSVEWVRQLLQQVRRWRPGHRLGGVVDGGLAAVSLALAGVRHHVTMVSR
jgi:hypothetical protein